MSDELSAAVGRVRYRMRSGQSAWLMQPTEDEWKDTAQVLFAFFESQYAVDDDAATACPSGEDAERKAR